MVYYRNHPIYINVGRVVFVLGVVKSIMKENKRLQYYVIMSSIDIRYIILVQ